MSITPEQITEIRDRVVPKVHSYAAVEGLSFSGAIQAAVRLGILAGIEAAQAEDATS